MVGRGEEREPVRRLLLVEDDPGDAFLVGELIAEVDPDLAVTVAGSMPEALPQLADSDCVLLDLNLPGYAGLDGLHTLLGADPLAAVCVLTGLDDEHLGTDAVAAGAQDYLVKGKVDGPLLIRAIRYAVERRRAETSLLRLREEQLVAAESSRLERGLLPSPLLAGSDVHSVTFYRAGRTRAVLGGDFFDAVRDADGTVHAIIGDVSGHGPDEAALGALLRVSWRALVLAGVGEERLLPELQRLLVSERHDSRLFTTACMITISGGVAVVRVAGHPPPVALWSVTTLTPPVGLPLGVGRASSGPRRPSHCHPTGRCCSTPTASSRPASPPAAISSGSTACWRCSAPTATPCTPSCPPGSSNARRPTTADRCSTTSPSCCW